MRRSRAALAMSDGLRGPDDPRSGGGLRRADQRSGRAERAASAPAAEAPRPAGAVQERRALRAAGRRADALRDRAAVLPGPGRAERPGARRAADPHAARSHGKALLPKLTRRRRRSTALPRDPLQTNYEYADNLSFNPANFTPFTSWVDADRRQREGRSRQASSTARPAATRPRCLADKAKTFVRTAFRGTPSDAQLARYADFFTASVTAVGLPSATADLVDVTLTSPGYVFRDEVLTDAAGLLLPAQHLQHITYTLADAPPEALGLSSATPNAYLADARARAEDDRPGARLARRRATSCCDSSWPGSRSRSPTSSPSPPARFPSSRRRSPPRWSTRPRRS